MANPYQRLLTELPNPDGGSFGSYYSLPALNDPRIDELPISIRYLLESAIRNCDNFQVMEKDIEKILDWANTSQHQVEIPFKPARVILQDFTGVPAVVDLAAMRDAMKESGGDPNAINPQVSVDLMIVLSVQVDYVGAFNAVPVDLVIGHSVQVDYGGVSNTLSLLRRLGVPVDLVIDHSVQVDYAGASNALSLNMEREFERNRERFAFLKWGSKAFSNMLVVPPGAGIVHQVNLEYLARVVMDINGLLYPDSVVGTDSHTTMIDGLGVAGWGVGGIEAEAAMLGQAMSMVLPQVVGFKLTGKLQPGVTATDLVLTCTQMLRKHGVVGKFVEFYGEGTRELSLADRATVANMSPEYGATMGFFPVDSVTLQYLRHGEGTRELSLADRATVANMLPEYGATMGFFPVDSVTLQYLRVTGRDETKLRQIKAYMRANHLFMDHATVILTAGEAEAKRKYSSYLELDLATVEPCVSGPKRPHDRVTLKTMKSDWHACLDNPVGFAIPNALQGKAVKGFAIPKAQQGKAVKGFAIPKAQQDKAVKVTLKEGAECELKHGSVGFAIPKAQQDKAVKVTLKEGVESELKHGSVVIAAITSCTNTSNPSVMLAAAIVAKKASERGLQVKPYVKTSLAPGSNVVMLAVAIVAKKASERGLQVKPYVKTSLAPGSNIVTKYLEARGLQVKPYVKTSLAPGSNVVIKYLEASGLLPALEGQGFHVVGYGCTTGLLPALEGQGFHVVGYGCTTGLLPALEGQGFHVVGYGCTTGLLPALEGQGFHVVGYGCTTCIGNSGEIHEAVGQAIADNDLVAAAVLSANYLASPPLVVAYAFAGTVDIDFEAEVIGTDKDGKEVDIDFETEPIGTDKDGKEVDIDFETEPIGTDKDGKEVFLRDIWPSKEEVAEVVERAVLPQFFQSVYKAVVERAVLPQFFQSVYKAVKEGATNALWNSLPAENEPLYRWEPFSTYIHDPPYFKNFPRDPPGGKDVKDAFCLLNVGDSITTDHISPAELPPQPPWWQGREGRVLPAESRGKDFNSYGSRRGNNEVMTRGTFANTSVPNSHPVLPSVLLPVRLVGHPPLPPLLPSHQGASTRTALQPSISQREALLGRTSTRTAAGGQRRAGIVGRPFLHLSSHVLPPITPGSIHKDSAAAKYLTERGVARKDFNLYDSRRGNDEVMTHILGEASTRTVLQPSTSQNGAWREKTSTRMAAGSIHKDSPAARYLTERGVPRKDFNSYGSRRGNDEVMTRGTFANIRLVNKLAGGEVGPKTVHLPSGEKMSVFDAAMRYKAEGHPTIVLAGAEYGSGSSQVQGGGPSHHWLAGAEYGSGSSRDWAAKGPYLQGVRAVISVSFERIHCSNLVGMGIIPLCFKPLTKLPHSCHHLFCLVIHTYRGVRAVISVSFERIHRSNLVGMGIIPLCFKPGQNAETLGLTGKERFSFSPAAGGSDPARAGRGGFHGQRKFVYLHAAL
ncbi:unnamed protein product [Closterium sp. NIES-64]|nr:unnamed protein product [Closterium sp. NIES-64]